ncbi:MAG: serine-threonine protein kinase [Chloroflexota bacterium]
MPETVAGFPYWEVSFDEHGNLARSAEVDALLAEMPGQALTDLFIFSHGWQNDRPTARALYTGFFAEMRDVLDRPATPMLRQATIGTVGVIWPSKRWADEPLPAPPRGGAASFRRPSPASANDADLVLDLKTVFTAPEQQQALDELARLLADRPSDPQALDRFQDLMRTLAGDTASSMAVNAPEDNGEAAGLLQDRPTNVFNRFATVAPRRRAGGAAGIGDVFSRLWDGAKEALRQLTYWQYKHRAGVIGKQGLGPLLDRLHDAQADLRIHLLGHSFGARLVSFALAGLPDHLTGADAAGRSESPIKSVTLLQGAFSHFSFADALPHDRDRSGALTDMDRRVDGPLLATHSVHDTAVGMLYALASIAGRDDAAAADDIFFRWGSIGHDGAQAVNAAAVRFGPVGERYPFTPGGFVNLNGDDVIKRMQPIEGAHGDIFHPEIAWATLAAAGIAGSPSGETPSPHGRGPG